MRTLRCIVSLTALLCAVGASPQRALAVGFLPPSPRTVSVRPLGPNFLISKVAFVPVGFPAGGFIQAGDLLAVIYDGAGSLPGRIVRVPPTGDISTFYQDSGTPGNFERVALVVSKSGRVFVGGSDPLKSQQLLILNQNGAVIGTLTDPLITNPVLDVALLEGYGLATLFITQVHGAVVRLDFQVTQGTQAWRRLGSSRQIGSGFFLPRSVAYASDTDQLFVLSSPGGGIGIYALNNATATTRDQGTGTLVLTNGGFSLAVAPNRNLLVTGIILDEEAFIAEITRAGKFVRHLSLPGNTGLYSGAFAVTSSALTGISQLAAVEEDPRELLIWTLP